MVTIIYHEGWKSNGCIWIECKNVDTNVNTNFALYQDAYYTMTEDEVIEICKVMLGVSD